MSIDASRWAWKKQGISPLEKSILLSLADRAGEDHTAWPSSRRLAFDLCLCTRSIFRGLNKLKEAKLIKEVGRKESGTVVYQLIGVEGREDEPLPPKKTKKTTVNETKDENIYTLDISSGTHEKCVNEFTEFDVFELQKQWNKWAEKQAEPPRSADAAFIGWCRKGVENGRLKPTGDLKKLTVESVTLPSFLDADCAQKWDEFNRIFSSEYSFSLWPSTDQYTIFCVNKKIEEELKNSLDFRDIFSQLFEISSQKPLKFTTPSTNSNIYINALNQKYFEFKKEVSL